MTITDERLAAAELVCHLFGWSPSHAIARDATDTEKAAHEAWATWFHLYGDLDDVHRRRINAQLITLAAQRDRKRAEIDAIIEKQIAEVTS